VFVTEPSDAVKAGMAKQTGGRLRLHLVLWLFIWFLNRHKRLAVNGVVRYFVKKGDSNLL
jgi:hypothetical protein